ncbi:hypothetical protein [Arthrobacter cavernae]|uniref:Uncharacterized protein n=1 Tax=Arthrobacter cavernae TaxID=2817681 RepID=A0A939KLC4_9MICC|nr:hypothetical protein [Arthrobacter cavernae]MBO1267103.1 hypothetical protein [Arthrobacter cavernae]
MSANEVGVMWGGIFFFAFVALALGGTIWAIKVIGPRLARHERKMKIETAIRTGMVDAQLQEEIVEDIVAQRLREQGR